MSAGWATSSVHIEQALLEGATAHGCRVRWNPKDARVFSEQPACSTPTASTTPSTPSRTPRATLYDKLGIEAVYQPTQRLKVVTADLVCQWLVSEVRPQPLAYPRLTTTLAL